MSYISDFKDQETDGYGDRADIALERDQQQGQIKENREALRFKQPPYSAPNSCTGEAALREINNGILDAINQGKTQYATAIWKGTFQDIEAYLENIGCSYGAWSHLEEWFADFAIAAGIGDPDLDDTDAPGSDKCGLVFSWKL